MLPFESSLTVDPWVWRLCFSSLLNTGMMNSLFIGILMCEALNVNAMSTCRKMIPNDWSPFFVAAYTSAAPSHIPQICNVYIYILSRWTFISTTVNYINGWSCIFLFGKYPFTSTKNSMKNWTTTPPWILLHRAWNCARHKAGVFLVLSNDGLVKTCGIGCEPKTNAGSLCLGALARKLVKWDDYVSCYQ